MFAWPGVGDMQVSVMLRGHCTVVHLHGRMMPGCCAMQTCTIGYSHSLWQPQDTCPAGTSGAIPGGLCSAHLHHMWWCLYVADTRHMPHMSSTACGGRVHCTALQKPHQQTERTEHRRATENSRPAWAAAAKHQPLQCRTVQK